MAGITQRLYDWLGNRLDATSASEVVAKDFAKAAMTEAAFRIATGYISSMVAKCPIRFYEGGRLVEDSRDAYAWNLSPNANESGPELMGRMVDRMLHEKEGALVVPYRGSLYLADSAAPSKRNHLGEDVFEHVTVGGEQVRRSYRASDVYLFRMPSDLHGIVDSMNGWYDRALEAAMGDFAKRCGRKYKLKSPAIRPGDTKAQQEFSKYVNESLKSFLEADSAVLPEYAGTELSEVGTSATVTTSSNLVNLRKDCFEAVAAAAKMPTSMLYGNVNNYAEVFRSFMSFAVDPVLDVIQAEQQRKTFGYDGWSNGDRVVIDSTHLKYTDLFDAADSASKLVSSGLLTPDGVAELLGLDPAGEEWSGAYWMTRNYAPAGEVYAGGGE
uniref:Phage portal protein n=1 Tax=uncultured bacterium Contig1770 TaxID=1393510 RepID=W0FLG3_9BACT|nr:phage portal protein [uncultured bacterium Contig1770]